jgi:hypothetical protein
VPQLLCASLVQANHFDKNESAPARANYSGKAYRILTIADKNYVADKEVVRKQDSWIKGIPPFPQIRE